MNRALTYDDVNLIPKYSELESRSLADTSVNLCGWKFKLPVVPANMEDVIDIKMAKFLSENGYFYIMHRFNINPSNFILQAENWKLVSISCGVNDGPEFIELQNIVKNKQRIDFITIDVAHGHHLKVKNRIQWIKENLPNTKIIAGNVATFHAYKDLSDWGADVIKAGVGQGSICTTRFQTGFSIPMFSCVKNIRDANIIADGVEFLELILKKAEYQPKLRHSTPIIADGGIKSIGDIPKALVAGATMVMSGKLFASCIDSPAQIINNQKQYRGSTSFAAKKHNKHIEGKVIELEADITVKERLIEIQESLSSAISYAGGSNLTAFKNVKWVEVNG